MGGVEYNTRLWEYSALLVISYAAPTLHMTVYFVAFLTVHRFKKLNNFNSQSGWREILQDTPTRKSF